MTRSVAVVGAVFTSNLERELASGAGRPDAYVGSLTPILLTLAGVLAAGVLISSALPREGGVRDDLRSLRRG